MNIVETIFMTLIILSYISAIFVSISIILENRDPSKTIAWLLIFILIPIAGLIVYIFFGRNIRERKIFKTRQMVDDIRESNLFKNLQEFEDLVLMEKKAIAEKKLLSSEDSCDTKRRVVNLLLNTGRFPFTINNNVKVFRDGSEKFDSLIEDLKNAKSHIHLEYFIIKYSEIGNKIKEILIQKSEEGVEVKILYDDVGCWKLWFNRKFFYDMRKRGILVYPFLPAKFPIISSQLNYRNHRKIAVIDGCIGYTGGINIGDEYLGRNNKFGYWRDTHIRIEGTSVYMLQMAFLMDWYFTTKEAIFEEKYFPSINNKGNSMVQVVPSGPDSDWEAIHYAYFTAICEAKEKIYIETPYFIPDESILKALKSAALSGVDVRIIFPKIADHRIVHEASYSYFGDILKAGGRVYLYNKGFIHSKVMIIDNKLASIGSANMDLRSFMLNFEVNAFLYDKSIVKDITGDFNEDLRNSEEITMDKYCNRATIKKIKESAARLFSPLL